MFQLCSMRSCNVDEFEYHRPEELPILCRYNFGGQFFYSFLITTRFCCIIVDYQDGRPPPFFSLPFKDLFDSSVFGFVQSDLRSNIAVRLFAFLLVHLNSSRYPHFLGADCYHLHRLSFLCGVIVILSQKCYFLVLTLFCLP